MKLDTNINIKTEIKRLLKEKNAILLAHNYQRPEIQDIADLCGDSLELSIKASQTDAKIIVFCGVQSLWLKQRLYSHRIKPFILPVPSAGCPMADMINAQALKKRRRLKYGSQR